MLIIIIILIEPFFFIECLTVMMTKSLVYIFFFSFWRKKGSWRWCHILGIIFRFCVAFFKMIIIFVCSESLAGLPVATSKKKGNIRSGRCQLLCLTSSWRPTFRGSISALQILFAVYSDMSCISFCHNTTRKGTV